MYYERIIDRHLSEWAARPVHKPVLLRGARQVGKSTAVRHLGESFKYFVEINLEKQPDYIELFKKDLDVKRIVPQMAAMCGTPIVAKETLLFIDEIQESQEAIMALRYFKEDMPDLHVVAAGSLLEFVLDDIPTFGVGRIHSMYMFPMTFDEFLLANDEQLLLDARRQANTDSPLPTPLHDKLVGLIRTFMLVGGMPESVFLCPGIRRIIFIFQMSNPVRAPQNPLFFCRRQPVPMGQEVRRECLCKLFTLRTAFRMHFPFRCQSPVPPPISSSRHSPA